MTEPKHDLMVDPLIRVRLSDGSTTSLDLPAVLARLAAGDEVASFPALRPHQQHAWHAFLCQLAAIAIHRSGIGAPPREETTWRRMLLALTDERREPWTLVVADLSQPAFMQPPVPERDLARYKSRITEPDALDVLVTAKNHDLKGNRIMYPAPDHWVFALVSLQTTQGYSGSLNYGIVRMKSGFGSRPGVAFAGGFDPGSRFRRDVGVLVEVRDDLLRGDYGYPARDGVALLWLEPWDGTGQIPIDACDPFFIETCRRIRLVGEDGRIIARSAPSRVRRIATAVDSGNTGDVWTPIDRRDESALTVGEAGFPYRRVQDLLFEGGYRVGAAARVRSDDPDRVFFIATALARGQGKTAGLHHRLVPLPARVRLAFGRAVERDRLAARAKERVHLATVADRNVLHPALCALLQGGPEKIDMSDSRTARWRAAFDAEIDRRFFPSLWADLERDDASATRRWVELLEGLAAAQLEDAISSAPVATARRYRAVASAERVFHGAWKKHLSGATETSTQEGA